MVLLSARPFRTPIVRTRGSFRMSRTCTNVIFLGPQGTGKTHLSLVLADRALITGHSMLFTTFAELAQLLETASHPGQQRQRLRRSMVHNLLVIDEVGYTKLSPEQARNFFFKKRL